MSQSAATPRAAATAPAIATDPGERREFVLAPGDPPDRRPVPVPLPAGTPQPGAGAGLAAWGELAVLGVLAVVGAFFASANASPGDYQCGMILIVAAIALAFLRLKARIDGASGDWASSLLVDDWASLTAVIVAFVVLGLIGLFLAAAYEYGGLHIAGLALLVASGAAVFLNLKHVFDIHDHRHDHRA